MNEAAARDVVLLRAYETAAPRNDAWQDDDRAWASRAAAEVVGGDAAPEQFLARRAALAMERLVARDRNVARTREATHWRRWVGWVVIAAAFALGFCMDAIGPTHRVNILAFPLLALLVWNLVIYVVVIGASVVNAAAPDAMKPGALRRAVARFGLGTSRSLVPANASMPLVVFGRDWVKLSSPLIGGRVARILHWAAFAFALGAVASLYLRGVLFEYRAGWESTFLDASNVQRLLSFVLAPASQLSGIAVPDAQHLATIRFPESQGENAAPWLHLYATTIALFVLLPRALLASIAGWRETRLRNRFPLSTKDAYFQTLLRTHRGETARIHVVPYSYQLSPQATLGLNTIMTRVYGAGAKVHVVSSVPFGSEDALPSTVLPADDAALVIVLFSLAATPEAEHHCILVSTLSKRAGTGSAVAVVIDESGFKERFADQPARIEERRNAWRRVLDTTGRVPVFIDLAAPDLAATEAALGSAINRTVSTAASA